MLGRRGFLRGLAAAPLGAMGLSAGASLLSSGQQAASEGEPIYTAYATESAGDWVGYLEAQDRSWITFIDKTGRASAWARDAMGQLHVLNPLVAFPGTHGNGPE